MNWAVASDSGASGVKVQRAMPRTLMLILRPKKSGAAFTRDRVRLQNQMECLLEMRIKPSIVVSNLLGASGIRILRALAEGETFVVIVRSS